MTRSPRPTRRAALARLLREPLTHFVLLGGALFLLYGLVRADPTPVAAAPRARVVQLGAAEIETLRGSYAAAWKREPSPAELADLAQTFLSEEILYREATTLGLDVDDEVVRRRLIEKMTVLVRPQAAPGEPSEAQLQRWYEVYRHRFRQPARIWFEQLYFDAKLRGDPRAAAQAALATLVQRGPADPPRPAWATASCCPPRCPSGPTPRWRTSMARPSRAVCSGRRSPPGRGR